MNLLFKTIWLQTKRIIGDGNRIKSAENPQNASLSKHLKAGFDILSLTLKEKKQKPCVIFRKVTNDLK